MTDRQLPHSIPAEESVLGSLLIDTEAIYDVADILQPKDFFRVKNRQIYEAILSLNERGNTIDFITLSEELRSSGKLDEPYLIGLLNVVPTAVQVRQYARIVSDLAKRRELIGAAGSIASIALDESTEIDTVLDKAQNVVLDVTTESLSDGPRIISNEFPAFLDTIMQRKEKNSAQVENPVMGFTDLDRLFDLGMEPGGLIVPAGRPGMGKSMFLTTIARNVAKQGKSVAFFSLEMSWEQVLLRLVSLEAGVNSKDLRRGLTDLYIIEAELEKMRDLRIWIDDTPSVTATQIHSRCRRIQAMYGLDLIMVDYLQLMTTNRRYDNRVNEVSAISNGLKSMAKSLDVPVVAAAQLSRAVEQRQNKRPMLSDLRDSGAIEQDADVVMFIYRDEYYNPEDTERPNVAEVNVAKNRMGETNQIDLFFNPARSMFANLDKKGIKL